MLFRTKVNLKIKSLQAVRRDAVYVLKNSKCSILSYQNEKASRCASENGSLTVEASLVVPLFLFAVSAVLYLFFWLQLQVFVGRALTDTARELSQSAYLTENQENWSTSLGTVVFGRYSLEKYLENQPAAEVIKGGVQGISLLGSNWKAEESQLTLRASYQILVPPGLSWFHPITVTQTKTVRGWTGFSGRSKAEQLLDEDLVYVTEYGRVYHQRLDCHHLKLSIRQTTVEETKDLRNTDGAKYYPCEHCWKNQGDFAYITEDGNRYHETLNCQGLARGIRTMRISEVGGRPPCSACGE